MGFHKKSEAALRSDERRQREDAAPRLKSEVPTLQRLDLTISDHRHVLDSSTTHVRRVVVAQAPALFDIPCADPSCKDGGHDVTYAVLQALKSRRTSFEGEDVCYGTIGMGSPCGRVLRFVAAATFAST